MSCGGCEREALRAYYASIGESAALLAANEACSFMRALESRSATWRKSQLAPAAAHEVVTHEGLVAALESATMLPEEMLAMVKT